MEATHAEFTNLNNESASPASPSTLEDDYASNIPRLPPNNNKDNIEEKFPIDIDPESEAEWARRGAEAAGLEKDFLPGDEVELPLGSRGSDRKPRLGIVYQILGFGKYRSVNCFDNAFEPYVEKASLRLVRRGSPLVLYPPMFVIEAKRGSEWMCGQIVEGNPISGKYRVGYFAQKLIFFWLERPYPEYEEKDGSELRPFLLRPIRLQIDHRIGLIDTTATDQVLKTFKGNYFKCFGTDYKHISLVRGRFDPITFEDYPYECIGKGDEVLSFIRKSDFLSVRLKATVTFENFDGNLALLFENGTFVPSRARTAVIFLRHVEPKPGFLSVNCPPDIKIPNGFKVGDVVRAKWKGYRFQGGTVKADNGDFSYGIEYESGAFEPIVPHFDCLLASKAEAHIHVAPEIGLIQEINAGDRVVVKMVDGSEQEGGVVIENADGSFGVRFEDSGFPIRVEPERILRKAVPIQTEGKLRIKKKESNELYLERENDLIYSAETYLSAYQDSTHLDEAYQGGGDEDPLSSSEEELTPYQKSLIGLHPSTPTLISQSPRAPLLQSEEPIVSSKSQSVPLGGNSDGTIRVFKDGVKLVSINKLRFFKDSLKIGEVQAKDDGSYMLLVDGHYKGEWRKNNTEAVLKGVVVALFDGVNLTLSGGSERWTAEGNSYLRNGTKFCDIEGLTPNDSSGRLLLATWVLFLR